MGKILLLLIAQYFGGALSWPIKTPWAGELSPTKKPDANSKTIIGSSAIDKLIQFFSDQKLQEDDPRIEGDGNAGINTKWMQRLFDGLRRNDSQEVTKTQTGIPSDIDFSRIKEKQTSQRLVWNKKWMPDESVLSTLDCRPQTSFRSCFEHCQELIPRPKVISLSEILTPVLKGTPIRRMVEVSTLNRSVSLIPDFSADPYTLSVLVNPETVIKGREAAMRAMVSAFFDSVSKNPDKASHITTGKRTTTQSNTPRSLYPVIKGKPAPEKSRSETDPGNHPETLSLDGREIVPAVRGYDEWGAQQLQKCVLNVCVTKYLSSPVPGCLTPSGEVVKVPGTPNDQVPVIIGPHDSGNFYDKSRQDFWKQVGYYEFSRIIHFLDSSQAWRRIIWILIVLIFTAAGVVAVAKMNVDLSDLNIPDHWLESLFEIRTLASDWYVRAKTYGNLLSAQIWELMLKFYEASVSFLSKQIAEFIGNVETSIDETECLIADVELKEKSPMKNPNFKLGAKSPFHQPFSDDASNSRLWMPSAGGLDRLGGSEDIITEHYSSSSDGTQKLRNFL